MKARLPGACMKRLVVFDMDSTLVDAEAINELARAGGVHSHIADITRRAMEGELNFAEALRERVSLLEGLSDEEIRQIADELPLMRGAEETVKSLHNRGYETAMVTGGFYIMAERIAEKLGIEYVVANELVFENGHLTGEVRGELVKGNKGDALRKISDELGIPLERCVVVGDGANDLPMMEEAGLAIAFNANKILYAAADIITEGADLTTVLNYIE